MRYIFKFPDIGEGITEGRIVVWHVEKGQAVEAGSPVVQMETDKVVTDIPSPKSGVVAARYGREGDEVKVGEALIELDIEGVEGEGAWALLAEEKEREKSIVRSEPVKEGAAGVVGVLEVANDKAYLPASEEGREKPIVGRKKSTLATPVAREMAKRAGIDISLVRGTGPAGRVTKEDIVNAKSGMAALTPTFTRLRGDDISGLVEEKGKVEIIKTGPLRQTIAKRMIESLKETAQISVFDEADAGALRSLLYLYRPRMDAKGIHLTYMPFIIKAAVAALREHPLLNSEMDRAGDVIVLKKYYNIGIAVDTPDGLLVPVIRGADTKSLAVLAAELKALGDKAKTRKLNREDMADGTFTITNYGAFGGRFATPVLNYPQTAILGVGKIREQAVVRDGALVPGFILPLSLTVDHRVIDGGEASRFLSDLIGYLSEPFLIFME